MKRRFLAALLAIMTAFSTLGTPVSAYAANTGDPPAATVEERSSTDVSIQLASAATPSTPTGPPLAGAQFTVKFYAGKNDFTSADQFKNLTPTRMWVIETDTAGSARLDANHKVSGDDFYTTAEGGIVLPLGGFTIQETKPAPGYTLDGGWLNAKNSATVSSSDGLIFGNIVQDGDIATPTIGLVSASNNVIKNEVVIRGGIEIQKYDLDTDEPLPEGHAKIGPIEFNVINMNTYAVEVDGKVYDPMAVIYSGKTDDNGYWKSDDHWLPYGNYQVVETVSPPGYTMEGVISVGVSIQEDGQIVSAIPRNKVDTGGVEIVKSDRQLAAQHQIYYTAQGDATLAGAEFSITYAGEWSESDRAVLVQGKLYEKGETIDYVLGPTAEDGRAATPPNFLPVGDYWITETKAPTGMRLSMEPIYLRIYEDQDFSRENWSDGAFDEVIAGSIDIYKTDADDHSGNPQGDGSLEGAVFELTNASQNAVDINGTLYEPGEVVWTYVTDANGHATMPAETLPYGTYTLKETTPPAGYLLNTKTYTVSIREDKKVEVIGWENGETDTPELDQQIIRGGIQLQKNDDDWNNANPQGDAVLGVTTFTITNASDNYVYVDGNKVGPGEVCYTVKTDNSGYFASDETLLPYGSYHIEETEAPVGYKLDGDRLSADFEIRENGEIVDLTETFYDPVQRYGFEVYKRDYETGLTTPLGGATLDGAVFELVNLSENSVHVDGTDYKPGEVITTITMDGTSASVPADHLPYGTYLIREVQAPRGYLNEGETERIFSIKENGKIVDAAGEEMSIDGDGSIIDMTGVNQALLNQVIRGDFSIRKIDSDTQQAMVGVKFRVTSLTTGESHEFTTNENGGYRSSSRFNPHTADTNGGLATSGMWFGQYVDEDGNIQMTEPNDSLGALPYDTYLIEELRCEANEGYRLWSDVFTISRNNDERGDNYEVNLNNIENYKYEISSKAVNTDDKNSKIIPGTDDVAITDTVFYNNLETGKSYTLIGFLYNATTGEVLKDADGNPVSQTKTFTPKNPGGQVDMNFKFDATGIDGGKVVVYQYLYETDDMTYVLAKHADPDDEAQTVMIPSLKTTAVESKSQVGVVHEGDKVTIVDTVAYSGVEPDNYYEVLGQLVDAETGEVITTDGKAVESYTTFRAASDSGEVKVTFQLDATDLAGHKVVAFEQLGRLQSRMARKGTGIVYAIHEDLNDVEQSIYIPDVKTVALGGATGSKNIVTGEEVTVVDTVAYTSVHPGLTYKVVGTLVDKTTGDTVANGETDFVADDENGTVDVTFTFDSRDYAGHELVAFETLQVGGIDDKLFDVATHEDIDDADQTVYVPAIRTTIADSESGEAVSYADGEVTLIDTVEYTALAPNGTYKLTGVLMDKATGNPLKDASGKEITATAEFTTGDETEGTTEVTFVFDGSKLAKVKGVAFETLYEGDVELTTHADINDDDQTVWFPAIHTSVVDAKVNDRMTLSEKSAHIIDTVTYENLKPGVEYVVDGYLVDQMNTADVAHGSTTFTPTEENGTIEVHFNFDARELKNHTIVAFETLYVNEAAVADHKDIHDEAQSSHVPEIKTEAVVGKTFDLIEDTADDDIEKPDPSITNWIKVISTVKYENLEVGQEYTVTSTLRDEQTGQLILDAKGNEITASVTFTPSEPNGEVEMVYEFEAPADYVLPSDKDGDGEVDGPVYYEMAFATKNMYGDKGAVIVDTVTYKNLIKGKEYTVSGVLMDKDTGKALVDKNGDPITASKTFVAPVSNGTVDVEFVIDASQYKGKTIVVFEDLMLNDVPVAQHHDLKDENQTLYVPELKTVALDGKTKLHLGLMEDKMVIVDTVTYTSVEPDKEYMVRGVLMDKATGNPALDADGNVIDFTTTVTPAQRNGSVDMTFRFDGSKFEGHTLVVYEEMYENGFLIGSHNDINDFDQTVQIPKLSTTLLDKTTGTHTFARETNTVLVDTVTYENVLPGLTYVVNGSLVDKSNGATVATDKAVFKPTSESGTVDVVFEFDAAGLVGDTVVAYETLTVDDKTIAKHENPNDEDQIARVVSIGTVAVNNKTDAKLVPAEADAQIKDTITYDNLVVGETYQVNGKLVDKATGDVVATASTEFTPVRTSGSVTLVFDVDLTADAGKTLVAFESVLLNGNVVAKHEDLTDADQTVYVPGIHTSAVDAETGEQFSAAKEQMVIADTVTYVGLEPGKTYTVRGYAVDQATGESVTTTVTERFTAEKASGSVIVNIPVNAGQLSGKTLVVFETLLDGNTVLAKHEDVNDAAQSVTIASEIETVAIDAKTEGHLAYAESELKLTDTITYNGLVVNGHYEMVTVLVDKTTGEIVKTNGQDSVATAFVPTESNGKLTVTVDVKGEDLVGHSVVFYEYLRMITDEGAVEIASHTDINDEAQTIHIPAVGTSALDTQTKSRQLFIKAHTEVEDTVTYQNLIPGETYVVTGKLVDKATGEDYKDANGNVVTATKKFKADAADGSVVVKFSIDATDIKGDSLVVFETLTWNGSTIATHADINDEAQTVRAPKIRTVLHRDGDKSVTVGSVVTVVDDIYYENFLPGVTYRISGTLMNKATGEAFLDKNGLPIQGSVTFVASESGSGIEHVPFTFDTTNMGAGVVLVAFEGVSIVQVAETDATPVVATDLLATRLFKTMTVDINDMIDDLSDDGDDSNTVDVEIEVLDDNDLNNTDETIVVVDGGAQPNTPADTGTSETPTIPVETTPDDTILDDKDIDNGDETIEILPVSIETEAYDKLAGGKDVYTGTQVTIADKVTYKNLTPGVEYTVSGKLVDKDTGETLKDGNGVEIYGETVFTPETKDGEVIVEFTLDTTDYVGKTLVAFEYLMVGDTTIASHADINDENQSVVVKSIEIGTKAVSRTTGTAMVAFSDVETIVDTVSYKNVRVGTEYEVTGYLVDKATGETLKDAAGNAITGKTTFVAESAEGSVDVTFVIDTNLYAGKTLVAFETMTANGVEVASHADINDVDQTVYVLKIGTVATGDDRKSKTLDSGDAVTVIDTVVFDNLIPGVKYQAKGQMVNKADGKPVGDAVNVEFTPEHASGTFEVVFTLNTSKLAGASLVATETVYDANGKVLAEHKSLEDADQTVVVAPVEPTSEIAISTSAVAKATGTKMVNLSEKAVIVDTVTYKNVDTGVEYELTGKLIDKDTKDVLKDKDGKEITSTVKFVPTHSEGIVEVTFTIDSTVLAGKSLVAFETLTLGGKVLATHADINDADQTVNVLSISTKATDGKNGKNGKTIATGKDTTIVDTVTYKNLIPGVKYKVTGVLVDQKDGKEICKPVSVEFTPKTANGTIDVTFKVDTSSMNGTSLVAYESVYDANGKLLAEHKDLKDADQTVTVKAPDKTTGTNKSGGSSSGTNTVSRVATNVVTGISNNAGIIAAVFGGLFVLTAAAYVIVTKKQKKNEE